MMRTDLIGKTIAKCERDIDNAVCFEFTDGSTLRYRPGRPGANEAAIVGEYMDAATVKHLNKHRQAKA